VQVKAPQGVAIESRAGDISASCLTDLKLQSVAGTVCFTISTPSREQQKITRFLLFSD
jgi:hypothetical protein